MAACTWAFRATIVAASSLVAPESSTFIRVARTECERKLEWGDAVGLSTSSTDLVRKEQDFWGIASFHG